jgi:hypothetical protein
VDRVKKHRSWVIERNRKRNKKRKQKNKEKKAVAIGDEVQKIKDSNLVHNFTDVVVPDDVYLYLSLGSTFVPSTMSGKHDDIYDAKAFCRKLKWQAALKDSNINAMRIETEDSNTSAMGIESESMGSTVIAPDRLKPKTSSLPFGVDKKVENVCSKLLDTVKQYQKTKPTTNLTHREFNGLKWCKEKVKDGSVYITRVDKGVALS